MKQIGVPMKTSPTEALGGVFLISQENVSLMDFFGDTSAVKMFLHEYKQQHLLNGLKGDRTIFLSGRSGNGKTMMAKIIAHELKLRLMTVNYQKFESENLENIVSFIAENREVYLFKWIDLFIQVPSNHNKILNFLDRLDSLEHRSIVIFCPSSVVTKLYPVDKSDIPTDISIHLDHPQRKDITGIMQMYLSFADTSMVDWEKIQDLIDVPKFCRYFSFKGIKSICRSLYKRSILYKEKITTELIILALETI